MSLIGVIEIQTVYSAEEIDTILKAIGIPRSYIEGNDEEFHFTGLSPRETKWRLEPYFPVLYECPNKFNIHMNDDGSWVFYRVTVHRTATM